MHHKPHHGVRRHLERPVRNYWCLYEESYGKKYFPKLNFTQFVNQNVKMLGRRLYSPSLVGWSLTGRRSVKFSNFPHAFEVSKFGRVDGRRGKKNYRQMHKNY